MKKSRYTEEQIIGVLRRAEAGAQVEDLCRKGGFSEATFYNGAPSTVACGFRMPSGCELESENAKLKKLLESRTATATHRWSPN